jgi:hypothetical protein
VQAASTAGSLLVAERHGSPWTRSAAPARVIRTAGTPIRAGARQGAGGGAALLGCSRATVVRQRRRPGLDSSGRWLHRLLSQRARPLLPPHCCQEQAEGLEPLSRTLSGSPGTGPIRALASLAIVPGSRCFTPLAAIVCTEAVLVDLLCASLLLLWQRRLAGTRSPRNVDAPPELLTRNSNIL